MDNILESYDHLTREDILAAIDYAATVISEEEMIEKY